MAGKGAWNRVREGAIKVRDVNSLVKGWLSKPEEIYRIADIAKFEKTFLNSKITTVNFEDMSKGIFDKKKRFVSKLRLLLNVAIMVRFVVLMASDDPQTLELWGEFMICLGTGRKVIHMLFFGLFLVTTSMKLCFFYAEGNGTAHFIYDMVHLANGTSTLKPTGLTIKGYKYLKVKTRAVRLFYEFVLYVTSSAFNVLWTIFTILSCLMEGTSRTSQMSYIFHMFISYIWHPIVAAECISIVTHYYIALTYLNILLNQLNEKLGLIVSPEATREHKSTKYLTDIMAEHNYLTVKVAQYNEVAKLILFVDYFVVTFSYCVTLFCALYFEFEQSWLKQFMYIFCIEYSFLQGFFTSRAGHINYLAHASYSDFNTIFVKFDKYKYDFQTRLKLMMTIKRIGGPAIGLYALDLFPFTYNTWFEFVFTTGSNFLLMVSMAKDVLGL